MVTLKEYVIMVEGEPIVKVVDGRKTTVAEVEKFIEEKEKEQILIHKKPVIVNCWYGKE